MRHIISINDLEDYTTTVMLAGSFGKGENKTLEMKVDPVKKIWFIVIDHTKKIAEVPNLAEAIDLYNKPY